MLDPLDALPETDETNNSKSIKPVVGKTFPLVDAAKAHRFLQERQNVGKVVLTS